MLPLRCNKGLKNSIKSTESKLNHSLTTSAPTTSQRSIMESEIWNTSVRRCVFSSCAGVKNRYYEKKVTRSMNLSRRLQSLIMDKSVIESRRSKSTARSAGRKRGWKWFTDLLTLSSLTVLGHGEHSENSEADGHSAGRRECECIDFDIAKRLIVQRCVL